MKESKVLLAPIISFCLVVLAAGTLNAKPAQAGLAPARKLEIDRVFVHFNNDTPAAALAVVVDGEIVYKQGYGMSNPE
jgi:CubicO group peptidase (beta-lactamase class C family)